MRRSTTRFLAVAILALLGAPVAMHVVMHDLHHHHAEHHPVAIDPASGHGDHEHPIVSSPAPPVPALMRAALPVVAVAAEKSTTVTRTAQAQRNVIAHGALRIDDDVGLQPLLSTFLI
jgi:hypothetical protein